MKFSERSERKMALVVKGILYISINFQGCKFCSVLTLIKIHTLYICQKSDIMNLKRKRAVQRSKFLFRFVCQLIKLKVLAAPSNSCLILYYNYEYVTIKDFSPLLRRHSCNISIATYS